MCGIVGHIGAGNSAELLIDGLKRLEYRGYDSSGIALLHDDVITVDKAVGKLHNLIDSLADKDCEGHVGIGHTRWATHGGVTHSNAHPHLASDRVVVVHNGIIENYRALREELTAKGHIFASDTDSEVISHLCVEILKSETTPQAVMQSLLAALEGAYALAILVKDFAKCILVARNASPLAIGFADDACFVASDAMAMSNKTRRVIYLKDHDYGIIRQDGADIYDGDNQLANREEVIVAASPGLVSKGGYRHFMEKEIHEQPDAVAHTLSAMTDETGLLTAGFIDEALQEVKGLVFLAAGTSNYAGQVGRYWIEKLAGVPVIVEVASEYRYRSPVTSHISHAVAISQSGESLDTLMAMRHAAENGLQTIGLVNVDHSTIAREADHILPTRAGPEIGVASTKAFTAQLTALLALAISLGRAKGTLDQATAKEMHEKMQSLPSMIGKSLGLFEDLRPIAHRLSKATSCLFLGRDSLFPVALEGALKLKELSYIHAEGFAAGEMKHGPIALIEDGLPVVSLLGADSLSQKVISNLKEAQARGADIILLSSQAVIDDVDFASHACALPDCDDYLLPFILTIPTQILAYLTASEKGTDVDQPRNLAKSVTVE
ncbi:MAG: glutamine--fructose-6-phosphate transaminase (isomerizing) [Candidatus Puniceispirillaceae bacterium]